MTHGFALRPFFAALRASRPAASMTDGFDVFVHEVIAAIATAPWSSVNFSPSARVDRASGFDAVAGAWLAVRGARAWLCSSSGVLPGGSDAGKDSAISRSTRSWSTVA